MVRRHAFTMIELIFAIVVMSIVVLSLPMIMQTDNSGREKNLAQEAALAASSKLSQVLSFQWDERSLSWEDLSENHQTIARILDGTNAITTAFDRNVTTGARVNNGHRIFFNAVTNATALGDDNTTLVNGFEAAVGMDEQNITFGANSGFDVGFLASAAGYKKDYQIQVDILRTNDALNPAGGLVDYTQTNLVGANRFIFAQGDAGGQTNLRCARVSIQDSGGKLITTLYGYSANIGEYSVASRVH